MRLQPEVRGLLWHLVERWPDLVRSQGHPKVPSSTNRLEGWVGYSPGALQAPGPPDAGLKTEVGAFNFVRLMARGMA